MDPWDLIKAGRYGEAIERYSSRLRRDKSSPNYMNRGLAYLNTGDFDSALADFQAADKAEQFKSDDPLQAIGVAHWLGGRRIEAATVWHDLVLATERGKIQYSDAAGGVESAHLLWFAAVRLGRVELLIPARRLLKKKAAKPTGGLCSIESWPGPIALFLLGRIKEERLRSEISDVPILRERELCQAEFYIGVRALEAGERARARKAFKRAADLDDAILENEFYLARHEYSKR
jgi:tetratricopeptide (TPR) repeat protein